MKGCRPLTSDEVNSVLEALDGTSLPPRNRALFLLGLRSGFRISELLSLRVRDVFQNGHFVDRVTVTRSFMKGKKEGRTVILHPEAKSALEACIDVGRDPDRFVFQSRQGENRALNRRTAWTLLKKAYAKCGLTGKLGTHSMRKTFAKRVHDKVGRDLIKTQKALGHKSVNSTVSYLSFDETEIDDAILKS